MVEIATLLVTILHIPEGSGPWRPPTDAKRKELQAKMQSSKRKEGPTAEKRPHEEVETSDDASSLVVFDPNAVLNLDPVPEFLMEGDDEDLDKGPVRRRTPW